MNTYPLHRWLWVSFLLLPCWGMLASAQGVEVLGEGWARHTIDDTSEGADGARAHDVNGDGLLDFVVPWEEGGVVRVYLHPGYDLVRAPWPSVTVGRVASPEDAVFVDLDGDGSFDVVSCTEGDDRSIYIHWGPTAPEDYMDADKWVTEALPAARGKRQWMFAVPVDIDGKHGIDLFAGSKNEGAMLGWFQAPSNARNLDAWQWRPVRQAAWTMSLYAIDMDDDNDWDIVYSERRGQLRGVWWLRNPGPRHLHQDWRATRMGGHQYEVMFMAPGDLDGDGERDFVAATRDGPILWMEKAPADRQRVLEEVWNRREIPMPENTGTGKSAAMGDINGDGTQNIVVSCENAAGEHGVFWLSNSTGNQWEAHAISGLEGTKYDMVFLCDMDGDGDLDVVTCEENENLGVIWYENPFGPGALPLPLPEAVAEPDAPVEVEAEEEVVEGEAQRQRNQSRLRRLFRNQ